VGIEKYLCFSAVTSSDLVVGGPTKNRKFDSAKASKHKLLPMGGPVPPASIGDGASSLSTGTLKSVFAGCSEYHRALLQFFRLALDFVRSGIT